MKRATLILASVILFITACGDVTPQSTPVDVGAIQTMTVKTVVASIPTDIPLENIELSKIAFVDGDLPPGYSPSQIGMKLSDISKAVPKPVNWFNQKIAKGNGMSGSVDIVIYDNQASAETAYKIMVGTMIHDNPSKPTIGDESLATSSFLVMDTVDVAFRHCNAAAHVQLMGTTNKDDAIAYMTRLDNRLKTLVCNP